MLYTYTSSDQTVATNASVNFLTNVVGGNCCIRHTAGTPVITINKSGYYLIEFNCDSTAETVGDITF